MSNTAPNTASDMTDILTDTLPNTLPDTLTDTASNTSSDSAPNIVANTILLSVRPEYAKKILAGTKKVELRRARPRLEPGDRVLVYVSSPQKAVVGSFQVEEIVEESLPALWEMVEAKAGISPEEFYNYYEGVSTGVGIFFKEIRPFNQPVALGLLRKRWSSWRPPQSYRYMSNTEYNMVRELGEG